MYNDNLLLFPEPQPSGTDAIWGLIHACSPGQTGLIRMADGEHLRGERVVCDCASPGPGPVEVQPAVLPERLEPRRTKRASDRNHVPV